MTTVMTAMEAAEMELKQTKNPASKAMLKKRIESRKRIAARCDSEPETQEGRKKADNNGEVVTARGGSIMQSAVRKAGLLALATLLFCGCSAQREISPRGNMESGSVADRRPCVAHFSVEGSYWSGHTVKSFEDYPNSSKSATFPYLISKIASVGYMINSSDKEAGLISASYPVTFGKGETTSLNAAVTERGRTGVRVDLTFTTGGMATFSIDEVQKEFCSILEGVPKKEKMETVETLVSEKPIVVEKPMVVEKPEPPAVPTLQPPSLKGLVVTKTAKLRAKASIKSKVISKLKKGEKLEILDRSGNWFQVKSSSGLIGWIFKNQVRKLN